MTTATHDFHPGNLVRARNREWVVQVSDNRQSDSDSLLPAELDAHCAPLYRLTRDELRYILDPADVMGANYPSETFRVLKNGELREFGEYRTQRLVLEAWDRLESGDLH